MVGGEGGSIPNLFHALFKICPANENTFCAPIYRGQRRGAFLSASYLKKKKIQNPTYSDEIKKPKIGSGEKGPNRTGSG